MNSVSAAHTSNGWLLQLALDVYEGRRKDEGVDLEFKTNLGWAPGDCLTIARSILGFANRPDVGCSPAVLLLGVEPGHLDGGREWIDSATVRQKLAKYVGEGPRWTVENLPIGDRWVQAFVVDSPQWGDPVYPLRSAGTVTRAERLDSGDQPASKEKRSKADTYQAGAIFVRHGSVTEGPTPDDIQRLTDRAISGDRYLRDVEVSMIAGVAHTMSDVLPEEVLRQERQELLAYLDHPRQVNAMMASILGGERRSREDYQQEVEVYLQKLGVAVPKVVQWWMAERPPVQFVVENQSREFREGAKLELKIASPCRVITGRSGSPTSPPSLPKRPRPFGSDSPAFGMGPSYAIPEALLRAPALQDPWDPNVYERNGVTHIELPPEGLRPEGSVEPRAIGLQVFTKETVVVSWSLTAKCAGRLQGEVEVPVEVHDPREVIAVILGELDVLGGN